MQFGSLSLARFTEKVIGIFLQFVCPKMRFFCFQVQLHIGSSLLATFAKKF